MKAFWAIAIALLCITPGLGQTGNGTIGGVVQDSSGALIPGVTITLTNTQTGIVQTSVTNEAGVYNFPSVLPGPAYRVTAELPGFQTAVFNDVLVGTAAQVRLNFTLIVGSVTQAIEVSVSAQALLTESSASIGEVLPDYRIRDLPLIGVDVLDLVRIMPGIEGDTFAGVNQMSVNTVRDGLSVSDGRFNNGVFGTTVINPDLVGEIRLILTPVDAEMGRGNGQVQIQTRSGTNDYSGSLVWGIRNNGLDANTWANNRNVSDGVWSPTRPDWENNHNITVSFGGPIIRNKTFFFALYDQQINMRRNLVTASVMTDTARQGIFRYFDGWNSGNALATIPNFPASATGGTYPVVDFSGNPVAPPVATTGDPYTGSLRCFSVFGTTKVDGSPFTDADCPGGIALFPAGGAAAWDTLRTGMDTTGYIRKILDRMPRANYFATGDGLNTAGHRFVRGRNGQTGAAVTTGTGLAIDRKQINLKIDHVINTAHRFSANWTYEYGSSDTDVPNWPGEGTYTYQTLRYPQVLTLNFTSTLSPSLVNEARFGLRYNDSGAHAPWELDPSIMDDISFPAGPHRVLVAPGAGNYNFGGTLNGIVNINPGQYNGNTSPLYNYANTLSWTTGAHALKFGAEARYSRTSGYSNVGAGNQVIMPIPRAFGGAGGNTSPINQTATAPGGSANLLQTARGNAANMLYFLAGSLNHATQLYWIENESQIGDPDAWLDTSIKSRRYRDILQREWSFFAKDDWKISRDLTLNIGLRWDYIGSPYVGSGLTTTPQDLGYGLFGVGRATSGGIFSNWLQAGNVFLTNYGNRRPDGSLLPASEALLCQLPGCDPSLMTTVEFVGPKTSNPDKMVIPADKDNWGPAVGFAWQVPWFGQGRTTVRGGYQVTFGGAGRLAGGTTPTVWEEVVGRSPGPLSNAQTVLSDFPAGTYLDLTSIPQLVPVRPTSPAVPGGTLAIYNRANNFSVYDPEWRTPYVQNFTLSVTRTIGRNLTADVRYVGTVSKKQEGVVNVNINNVYYNPELLDALERTRRGEDVELFDHMLAGLRLNDAPTAEGYGPVGTVVNGVLQRGSAHIRRHFAANMANGNFSAVATSLNTLSTVGTGGGSALQPLPTGMAGVSGRVLRNGCDRIANGVTNIPTRCFPENYIVMNPQLGTPNYITNSVHSNYHSLQAQLTLRPVNTVNVQGTYTWAKNLGIGSGPNYTDPFNRDADYSGNARTHDFRLNGGFELPFGPNKLFFGNSSGLLARVLEGWKMSTIFRVSSGALGSIAASNMFYSQGRPDIVGPWNVKGGQVRWEGNSGSYFDSNTAFELVRDPQCNIVNQTDSMGFNLFDECTLDAIADANTGQILLQHPLPGGRGTLGSNTVRLLGLRNFDANISKEFQISESKRLQIRMDASNVLNSPNANDPNLSINSDNFGQITSKGNNRRQFQGQVRLSF